MTSLLLLTTSCSTQEVDPTDTTQDELSKLEAKIQGSSYAELDNPFQTWVVDRLTSVGKSGATFEPSAAEVAETQEALSLYRSGNLWKSEFEKGRISSEYRALQEQFHKHLAAYDRSAVLGVYLEYALSADFENKAEQENFLKTIAVVQHFQATVSQSKYTDCRSCQQEGAVVGLANPQLTIEWWEWMTNMCRASFGGVGCIA